MNIRDKQKLNTIIDQLTDLSDKAYLRSQTIIENGQEIPPEHRAKSLGYYGAYTYTIMLLKRFLDEQ